MAFLTYLNMNLVTDRAYAMRAVRFCNKTKRIVAINSIHVSYVPTFLFWIFKHAAILRSFATGELMEYEAFFVEKCRELIILSGLRNWVEKLQILRRGVVGLTHKILLIYLFKALRGQMVRKSEGSLYEMLLKH